MTSAGRILIMPKGNYDASVSYEMLDLVKHNGSSWIAKKTVVGIEPSDASSEHWQNMFDVDISKYVKKEELSKWKEITSEFPNLLNANEFKVYKNEYTRQIHIFYNLMNNEQETIASQTPLTIVPSEYMPIYNHLYGIPVIFNDKCEEVLILEDRNMVIGGDFSEIRLRFNVTYIY